MDGHLSLRDKVERISFFSFQALIGRGGEPRTAGPRGGATPTHKWEVVTAQR